MNLSDQIQAWLDADGSYLQGVALYRQTGGLQPAGYYEKYFRVTYIPPEKKKRLRKDLQKFLINYPPTNVITFNPQPAKQKRSPKAPPEEPEAIQALRQRAIPLHKRYSHLKAELYVAATADSPDEKKCYELSQQIMSETIPALDHIYDQIREWERTGEVPEIPRPLLVEQTVEKMKSIASMRSRISNLRNAMKKGKFTEQETIYYESEIAEKELLIAEVCAELGLDT